MENHPIEFYLGANSAAGFVSLFSELYNENSRNAVILKGGPGTGKSTLMKKIAAAAAERGDDTVEYIHCSSDPDSLDAVIFDDGKCCIADGTAPHTLDPKWPGAVDQIINLGDCWDKAKLVENKEKIVEICKRKTKLYEMAYKFIGTANIAMKENFSLIEPLIRKEKLQLMVDRLVESELPRVGAEGKEKRRLLSGITPNGVFGYFDTVEALCRRVYVFEDEHGIAPIAMARLRDAAVRMGYTVYGCYCPVEPLEKLEHLLIPSLSLGFVTANEWHRYEGESVKTVNMRNYLTTAELKNCRARLAFNNRSVKELLEEAVLKLSQAKELHGMLEKYYVDAMDFAGVEQRGQEAMRLFGLA